MTEPTIDASGTRSESERASEFSLDREVRGIGDAVSEWYGRLRTGEPGVLPSLLGLLVLGLIFSQVSGHFLSSYNIGLLPGQGASTAVIALGLVFVLLLGEIDLSAGTAGGTCAAIAAIALHEGNLKDGVSTGFYWAVIVGLVLAAAVAVWLKVYVAVPITLLGALLILTNSTDSVVTAMVTAICIGAAIGILNGVLVAKIGIPSFVVTLALFLAWGGVTKLALSGQPIDTSNFDLWRDLTHGNLSPTASWVFTIVLVGVFVAWTVVRSLRLKRAGLARDQLELVLLRGGVLAVVAVLVTLWAVQNRNPIAYSYKKIEGIPVAAALAIVLMVLCALLLTKTTWGRHLYATGGNQEAARRAGIDVIRIKVSAFMLCSMFAAGGGILISSHSSSVALDLGGGNVLLFAVAAAVIGGTSLFGGRGRPRDAILGALVITIIPNGLALRPSINAAWQDVITGVVLLIAASVDAVSRKRAARG